ncbi:hypothetical protein BDV12DRAFT_198538 [Aspergillus spectabilis]
MPRARTLPWIVRRLDSFTSLPFDAANLILQNPNITDIMACERVTKDWKGLIPDPGAWTQMWSKLRPVQTTLFTFGEERVYLIGVDDQGAPSLIAYDIQSGAVAFKVPLFNHHVPTDILPSQQSVTGRVTNTSSAFTWK